MPLDIRVRKPGYGFLDHRGDPEVEVVPFATDQFLTETVGSGRIHYLSHAKFGLPSSLGCRGGKGIPDEAYPIPTTGLLIQTAHACFATHRGFGLSPDVVWQTIVHQVAEHIKLHFEQYAGLFAADLRHKPEIEVRDDQLARDSNWLRTLGLFEGPLREAIGQQTVSLFVPNFSTTSPLDRVAALVALMDAASPYYAYSVKTMCHIPLIQLEGTAEDWQQLYRRATALGDRIVGLAKYFTALLPVLQEIAGTAAGKAADNRFWSSLYKFVSESRCQSVTGWLTTLLAFRYGAEGPVARDSFGWGVQGRQSASLTTNQIPSLLSTVPFTWKYMGTHISMLFVAGALGVSNAGDSVFTPKLGIAVMER